MSSSESISGIESNDGNPESPGDSQGPLSIRTPNDDFSTHHEEFDNDSPSTFISQKTEKLKGDAESFLTTPTSPKPTAMDDTATFSEYSASSPDPSPLSEAIETFYGSQKMLEAVVEGRADNQAAESKGVMPARRGHVLAKAPSHGRNTPQLSLSLPKLMNREFSVTISIQARGNPAALLQGVARLGQNLLQQQSGFNATALTTTLEMQSKNGEPSVASTGIVARLDKVIPKPSQAHVARRGASDRKSLTPIHTTSTSVQEENMEMMEPLSTKKQPCALPSSPAKGEATVPKAAPVIQDCSPVLQEDEGEEDDVTLSTTEMVLRKNRRDQGKDSDQENNQPPREIGVMIRGTSKAPAKASEGYVVKVPLMKAAAALGKSVKFDESAHPDRSQEFDESIFPEKWKIDQSYNTSVSMLQDTPIKGDESFLDASIHDAETLPAAFKNGMDPRRCRTSGSINSNDPEDECIFPSDWSIDDVNREAISGVTAPRSPRPIQPSVSHRNGSPSVPSPTLSHTSKLLWNLNETLASNVADNEEWASSGDFHSSPLAYGDHIEHQSPPTHPEEYQGYSPGHFLNMDSIHDDTGAPDPELRVVPPPAGDDDADFGRDAASQGGDQTETSVFPSTDSTIYDTNLEPAVNAPARAAPNASWNEASHGESTASARSRHETLQDRRQSVVNKCEDSPPSFGKSGRTRHFQAPSKREEGMGIQKPRTLPSASRESREGVLETRAKNREGAKRGASEQADRQAFTAAQGHPTQQPESIKLLCSEYFLEHWSSVVAELASGRWADSVSPQEEMEGIEALIARSKATGRRIQLFDSPLMEKSGVDIEVSGRVGLLVVSATALQDIAAAKTIVMPLAKVQATGRYARIVVFICYDADMSSQAVLESLLNLQTSCIAQNDDSPTYVSFQTATRSSLSGNIAETIISYTSSTVHALKSVSEVDDDHNAEASFLMGLIPTLSATGSHRCLSIAKAMRHGRRTNLVQLLEGYTQSNIMLAATSNPPKEPDIHPLAMLQLSHVSRVALASSQDG